MALSATNQPLVKELWAYFYETYFTDETVYEHLNMGGGSLISVRNIVLGLCFGLCVAAFGIVFNKRVLGGFVRHLLKNECLSAETAKTLPELNYADKLLIRHAVKKSVNLRRVVRCREEEAHEKKMKAEGEAYAEKQKANPSLPKKFRPTPFRVKPDEHHFYIPEDLKYMADVKFEQKGTTWLGATLFVFIMLVATVAVLLVLPKILSLVNELAGSFGASSDQVLT
jgi:hypothetical protein